MVCGGALVFTACTDGNDWEADSSHARLFAIGSSSLKLTTFSDHVIISFDGYGGEGDYVVELSQDTLYQQEVATDSRIVYLDGGSEKTIDNLEPETKYFLRVKKHAEGQNDSKWIYYTSSTGARSFKTKAEQLFNAVTDADILENQITVKWKSTKNVTRLVVSKGGEKVQDIALTGAEPQDSEGNFIYTITGLNAGSTYTIELYDGDVRRGKLSVKTATAPDTDSYVFTVPAGTSVSNALVKAKAQEALDNGKNSLTIVLEAGQEYLFGYNDEDGTSGAVLAPTATNAEGTEVGMSVTFLGAGGDRATLTFKKSFDSKGDHTNVVFQHLNLVDDGANYFFNQSEATNVESLTVEDCEAKDFKNAFFRMQGGNDKVINKLSLINCIFHDMCSGYSFVHVDASSGKGVVKNLYMKDCTLYSVAEGGKMFIYSKNTNMESIVIENMTMNNSIGNGNFLIDFGSTDYGVQNDFLINNTIFGASAKGAVATKVIRGSKQPICNSTIFTKDCVWGVGDAYGGKAEDLFKDPENADFTIIDAGVSNMGDSRWFSE